MKRPWYHGHRKSGRYSQVRELGPYVDCDYQADPHRTRAAHKKPQWANKKYRRQKKRRIVVPHWWVSTLRVAMELGVSESTVVRRVRSGQFVAVKDGRKYWINPKVKG